MGEFDDMNSTPIGKLPLPVVQSKADGPRVDLSTSYADILKAQAAQPPPGPSSLQPPHQQHQQHQFAPEPAAAGLSNIVAQHFDAPVAQGPPPMRRRRSRRYDDDDDDDDVIDDGHFVGRRGRRCGGLLHKLLQYKTSLIVVVVMFLMLWYVAPKLAQVAPVLLSPSGKFNTLGLLAISVATGGVHRVVDHYVP